jgi:hypothetical protein
MKRTRESASTDDETISNDIITGTCTGLYVQEYESNDVICLIFSIMKNEVIQKDLYSIILDENSVLLLSPFLIHTIQIKPYFTSSLLNYSFNCYKIISFNKSSVIDRLQKEDRVITTKKIKKIIIQTFFLTSTITENNLLTFKISDIQKQLLKYVFNNENSLPIIEIKDKIFVNHANIITTLCEITNQKKNKKNKKRKLNEGITEDINTQNIEKMKSLSLHDIFKNLLIASPEAIDFFKIYEQTIFTKKHEHEKIQLKAFQNKGEFLRSIYYWKNNLKYVFSYRTNQSFEHEMNLRYLISPFKYQDSLLKFNDQNITLAFFTDYSIEKFNDIYKLILKNYYKNLIDKKIKTKDYLKKCGYNENEKTIESIESIQFKKNEKSFNIVNLTISLLRNLFLNHPKEEIINDDFIIDDFIDFLIDSIITNLKNKLTTRYMSVVTLNIQDLLYLISKIFLFNINEFKQIDNNDDYINKIKTTVIINEMNSCRQIFLIDIISKLFSKLTNFPNNFKINKSFKQIFELYELPLQLKNIRFIDLLCYINKEHPSFKYENYNYKILKHDKIVNSSHFFNLFEKESYIDNNLYSNKTIFNYITVSRDNIAKNQDLNSFKNLLNSKFNNFTLIHQSSRYSYNRSTKFIESFIKSKDEAFSKSLLSELDFLDQEIFNLDDDEPMKQNDDENNMIVELPHLKEFKKIKEIDQNHIKNLFFIDSHLIGCKEWYHLFDWIISNLKNIENIYFIGCPFLLPPKCIYGQPFIDALFQNFELQIKSILFNKESIQNNVNQGIFEEKEINNTQRLKNSIVQTFIEYL